VVVTSSSNAISTSPNRSAYTAAKRGLVGMVQSAAHDYAADGIRINLALASDDFPYMTAAQMVIDGGKTAYA